MTRNEAEVQRRVGQRIRTLRTDAGIRLQDLADGAGLSVGALGEIERGEVNPRITKLLAIVAALDLPSIELLIGDPPLLPPQPSRALGQMLVPPDSPG